MFPNRLYINTFLQNFIYCRIVTNSVRVCRATLEAETSVSGSETGSGVGAKTPLKVGSGVGSETNHSGSTTLNKRPLTEVCTSLAIRILIGNSCTKWRRIFKELSQERGTGRFFKKSPRLSLKKKYLQYYINLISGL
jgi:hypothetical protein